MWNLFQNTFYMMPGVITPNQQERTDIWSPIGFAFFEPRDYRGVSFHNMK